MIVDVPTAEEFRTTGTAFLNLAWDATLDLMFALENADVESWDEDGTVTDEYWRRAQRPLATAVALAQQGTEFLVKARIAAVSPYLLLTGGPRDWPKACDKVDTSYSAYHSIDAQDLLRAHDAVALPRLSEVFRSRYEQMRRDRNAVFHTVDKTKRFAARDVLLAVLEVSRELLPGQSWISARKQNFSEDAHNEIFPDTKAVAHIAREFVHVVDALTPHECRHLLGLSKKQRFYYCPACRDDEDPGFEWHAKAAQLRPNTSTSIALWCWICETERPVTRAPCDDAACPGNVVDDEEDRCLTCGLERDPPPGPA